ncbi:nuclear transport factor 2 family protein [Litoribrevibacter euphylliae]|uniref:Nuclear transport factor 2 family protein n=1 Tax=Litoribrevibacter euphylliae TaxID=1834034 RepID=A0ABV7HQ53_9GAMM
MEQTEAETMAGKVVERFKDLFHHLNADNAQGPLIDQVYQGDMVFEDSFHRIEGLSAFKDYCESVYENLDYCCFDFHQAWINQEDAMLIWSMRYVHPRLNRGKEITIEGSSHIRFDHKVYYHRDYFDGGKLLYEHIPVLGSVIQQLKKRMV